MEFIKENWQLILVAIIGISAIIIQIVKSPKKIKEWLIYAVTLAEKELGEKTGKIKLRYVYDLFVTKFPIISKIISFDIFSNWVDDALVELKKILETNKAVSDYIEK